MSPSPFEIGRNVGNNLGNAFAKAKDENAIEQILSQAMGSGDPEVLQNSIGKILSQVSPERQGMAVQYIQNKYKDLQQQKQLERELQERSQERSQKRSDEISAGVVPGLAPAVQAQLLKDKAKQQRLSQYGLDGDVSSNGQVNQSAHQPNVPNQSQGANQTIENPFEKFSNSQLDTLQGHPDLEVRNASAATRKSRIENEKEERADKRELRKETFPLKKAIIDAADLSRESIRNKNHLIDIIDRGNLDDPSIAVFLESLPLNLGKRMLSNDTVEYKGGLVDEFGDLKNIFKGATRVKEVEIYENKLADLYLTDSQKKAILKSRINASKSNIVREKAAQEVEEKYPNISALQFNKKVDEIAKPEIDKLFNSVWDEQKSILDQAERKKDIPLDPSDPEDLVIMQQIKKEAGGNKEAAKKLAKKKGYKVIGEK